MLLTPAAPVTRREPDGTRAKRRRAASPVVLGTVLVAAIAAAGVGGWALGSSDPKAKPDPTVVAAQRSAAAEARAADTQERERVAWLDSANTSVKRLDDRRAAYRQSLARATTPSDQAAAARRLASSFAAGQALVKDAPASVTGAAALGEAMSRAEAAYTRLATSAHNGNRSAYRRAADSVRKAEADVAAALKALGNPPA